MRPETLAAQALHAIDRETGAIVPPIHLATTFARDADYQPIGPIYARDESPAPIHAEKVIAALESGAAALVFSSGMAAATAAIRSLVRPGDHIIAPKVGYYALRNWTERFCTRWGVGVDFVDMTDQWAIRSALRPGVTKLVWIETPANPTWELTDIFAVADLAHGAGARLAVDSTTATPVHTRPLELGADLVMHSATKYLAGHSDVLAGALVTARIDDAWAEIAQLRHDEGPCIGPLEAYLLLRGMRTLYARVERSGRTAQGLADRLAALPGVTVRYPGRQNHPQHALAQRQMQRGYGSMLSIQVGGAGPERALAVVKRLRVWVQATSLGGVESLVEHRFSVEGANTPTPPDLLRLSVGLEREDDLFEDLHAALSVPVKLRVATCKTLPEVDVDEAPLAAALAAAGFDAELLAWDDPTVDWDRPIPTILRSTWNYALDVRGFLAWIDRVAAAGPLLNPPDVVHGNVYKRYLVELAARGVGVVPTEIVEKGTTVDLAEVAARFGTPKLVIKPEVGAGSLGTRVFTIGGPHTNPTPHSHLAALTMRGAALVQPYVSSVDGYGERSLVWIDGALSHAIRKNPRFVGDIEKITGPHPIADDERELAEAALAPFADRILYGRVDVARDALERPVVMELELVEPSLFFARQPGAADRFVAGLRKRLP